GAQSQDVASKDCATGVHAIISRGQGAGDDLSVMKALSDRILDQIPGSTTLGFPFDHDAEDKFTAVHSGALMLQQYVKKYVKSCPKSKIVLVGYSLGAVLTMEAVCGTSSLLLIPVPPLDPSYNTTVIANIVYGDETFVPFQPWNTGNCTVGAGIFPRLNPSTCDPFASSLHSYCDYGDNQCCSPLPMDDNHAHHTYMKKYDQDVVDFIKERLRS
ncbi:acetylxylan esterase precursor, partial [Penicillium citrinum]